MHLRRYRSDIFTDKYKRLAWDEVSRSITAHIAKDGYWYIHPQQHRTLSVREAARVQTFPDWFRFAGQPTLRLKQIGNAVPPLLGRGARRSDPGRAGCDAAGRRRDAAATSGRSFSRGTRVIDGDYPWRAGATSPWLVLAAELCLARTRADLVPVIYERLCALAPSPRALLARADPVAELKAIGLGHASGDHLRHRSARSRSASMVRSRKPSSSCARCRASATTSPRPFGRSPSAGEPCCSTRRRADSSSATSVDRTRADGRSGSTSIGWRAAPGPDAAFNHALLDHGALVCRAETPRCDECPLRSAALPVAVSRSRPS